MYVGSAVTASSAVRCECRRPQVLDALERNDIAWLAHYVFRSRRPQPIVMQAFKQIRPESLPGAWTASMRADHTPHKVRAASHEQHKRRGYASMTPLFTPRPLSVSD